MQNATDIFEKSKRAPESTEDGLKEKGFSFSLKGLQGRIMALLLVPLFSMVAISILVVSQITMLSSNLVEALAVTVPSVTTSKELQLEIVRLDSLLSGALAVQKDQGELDGKLADLDMSIDRFSTTLERYLIFPMPVKADKLRGGVKQTWAEMSVALKTTQKLFADKKFADVTSAVESNLKPTLAGFKTDYKILS